jgi:hypothetical protein
MAQHSDVPRLHLSVGVNVRGKHSLWKKIMSKFLSCAGRECPKPNDVPHLHIPL